MESAPLNWLPLVCPACETEFRIKEAYGHLRGRCPSCGERIQPPRPRSYTPAAPLPASDSLELLPLEDEWPEPAIIEAADVRPAYEVNASPVAHEPKEAATNGGDIFQLAASETAAPAAKKKYPDEMPYDVFGGAIATAPERPPEAVQELLRHAADRLEETKESPPPEWPLLLGIYTFPFRLANLGRFFWLGVGLTVLALQTLLILWLFTEGSIAAPFAIGFFGIGALWMIIWAGTYASGYLLAVIDSTAGGNDEAAWPDESWKELFFELYYVFWLLACCVAIPAGLLSAAEVNIWLILLIVTVLFPIGLMSSLCQGNFWFLLDLRLVFRLIQKPSAFVMLFVHSFIILGGFAATAYYAADKIGMAPVLGFLASACILIYGRVIGRVLWVLEGGVRKTHRVKESSVETGASEKSEE